MDKMHFSIPLAPVTKKNHQRIVRNGDRVRVIPSKQYAAYEKAASEYIPLTAAPIDFPVEIRCLFYMPTRRRVDLTNLLEAVDDVLVKTGVLADDNSRVIVSHDGSRVLYDKHNPRTEVTIRKIGTEEGKNGF